MGTGRSKNAGLDFVDFNILCQCGFILVEQKGIDHWRVVTWAKFCMTLQQMVRSNVLFQALTLTCSVPPPQYTWVMVNSGGKNLAVNKLIKKQQKT